MSTLDPRTLHDLFRGSLFHNRIQAFFSIDSTNVKAVAEAHAGQGPAVYIADEQTAGKGRGGHQWHSEPGNGLYMTVLLRPSLDAHHTLKISLAMGLVAQDAVERTNGLHIDLRWPNDLLTTSGSRKLGGILTETAIDTNGKLRFAAVGIGINLNQPSFPQELQKTATSLLIETGATTRREELIYRLATGIAREVQAIEEGADNLLQRFEQASTWARGKRVHVSEDEGYTGTTAGLTADGLLRIACDTGGERIVRHGGVRELY
jgi:BirA family biotin operon repressor/biotin-[acetyl-CoA-carboxylase] ligase